MLPAVRHAYHRPLSFIHPRIHARTHARPRRATRQLTRYAHGVPPGPPGGTWTRPGQRPVCCSPRQEETCLARADCLGEALCSCVAVARQRACESGGRRVAAQAGLQVATRARGSRSPSREAREVRKGASRRSPAKLSASMRRARHSLHSLHAPTAYGPMPAHLGPALRQGDHDMRESTTSVVLHELLPDVLLPQLAGRQQQPVRGADL
jgi:hypothetical protein